MNRTVPGGAFEHFYNEQVAVDVAAVLVVAQRVRLSPTDNQKIVQTFDRSDSVVTALGEVSAPACCCPSGSSSGCVYQERLDVVLDELPISRWAGW